MTPEDPDPPLAFERIARSRVAGCLAYGLMLPVAGLVCGLLAGLLGYGLSTLVGLKGDEGAWLLFIFFPVGFFGVLVWGLRDYRRRAKGRIEIHRDRLEVSGGSASRIFRFEDLEWIEGAGVAASLPVIKPSGYVMRLRDRDGTVLPLGVDEWPVKEIAQGLLDRAVPVMTRVFNARIEAGEAVDFRPGFLQSLRFLATGVLFTGTGAYLFFRWGELIRTEKTFRTVGLPILLVLTGTSALVMVRKARGGILIDRDGVRSRSSGERVPWGEIERLRLLPDAASLETQDGRTFTVGTFARNYEVCVSLLRSRIKE
jgi:hypothetical protein